MTFYANNIFKCIFLMENVGICIEILLKYNPVDRNSISIGSGYGLVLNLQQVITLTHGGRVMHIYFSKLIIGSDNCLLPGRRQAIIWTNAGILLIQTLGTNICEILSKAHTFSFKKMHLKMSSGKWRPFWLCLNVLTFADQVPWCHIVSHGLIELMTWWFWA